MNESLALTVGPNAPDNVKFGELLESLRTRISLSRVEVARRIGVSSEYIRVIERGERTPALGTMLQILDVYEVRCHRNKSIIIFGNVSVEFTSRIKERRHSFPKSTSTRNELIGQIISSLVVANDDRLEKVHKILTRA